MSTRNLTTALRDALLASKVNLILLAYFDFASGAVRVWNGQGDLSWNSQTWRGLGEFGSVSPIEEGVDLSARSVTFQLRGIPSDLLTAAMTDHYQGREASLWLAALTDAGAIVADPFKIFSGRMDVMEVIDDGRTGAITLTGESRLIDLQRSRERRYTDEDQQFAYPGDRGCEYVAGLQNKQLPWGGNSTGAPGGGAPVAAGSSSSSIEHSPARRFAL